MNETTPHVIVATEIYRQLGGAKFAFITGAKVQYAARDGLGSLTLKLPSRLTKDRATHMRITLEPSDTYRIEVLRLRGTKIANLADENGIYNDMLRDRFEALTGLVTSLGTLGR